MNEGIDPAGETSQLVFTDLVGPRPNRDGGMEPPGEVSPDQGANARQCNRQDVFEGIIRGLAGSVDDWKALESIVQCACRLFDAPASILYRRDKVKGRLAALAVCVSGKTTTGGCQVYLQEKDSLAKKAMASGQALHVDDVGEVHGLVLPYPEPVTIRSMASAPVAEAGNTVGVLEIYFDAPRSFAIDDLKLLFSLGAAATIALTTSSLIDQQREALMVRDEFITRASHELRTPLTTIRGLVDLLIRREQKGLPPDPKPLATVRDQLRRLTNMVNDLLDIANLTEGHLEVQPEQTDIVAIARGIVNQVRELSPRHQIQLSAPERLVGWWDPHRLDQLLANLLSNAVKYSPSGGMVLVDIRQEDGNAHVTVRDFGIGIPEEDQSRLFRRFARASNVGSRRFSGMGLGLSISKEIVELHGGRIWVESRRELGSTFHFILPMESPAISVPQAKRQERADIS